MTSLNVCVNFTPMNEHTKGMIAGLDLVLNTFCERELSRLICERIKRIKQDIIEKAGKDTEAVHH